MGTTDLVGWETNTTGEQNLSGGTRSTSTTIVHSGVLAVSVSCTQNATASFYSLNPMSTTLTTGYARVYAYIDVTANPSAGCTANEMFTFSTGAVTSGIAYDVDTSGVVTAYCRHTGNTTVNGSTTKIIEQRTWHCFEIKVVMSTTVGIVEWRLDGTTIETLSSQNISASANSAINMRTIMNGTGTGAMTIYYDDLHVRDDAYPGPGKIIVRQGKAGTPTYDAWTKNGLATAALCWSETPVGTTNTCSQAGTAAAAQTMLVASFNSPSTGHGTEVIGANDTINACKVVAVAKVSNTTGAPTLNIRRRISGSDTDSSAITLTTGDVLYNSSYFTDTVANLNSAEIGANRSTSGSNRTVTVEDVWLVVDYTPAATASLLASAGVGTT